MLSKVSECTIAVVAWEYTVHTISVREGWSYYDDDDNDDQIACELV